MKATINFDLPKVISDALAEQGYKRKTFEQSLALIDALFNICDYESHRKYEGTDYSLFEIKFEADMSVASALASATDHYYLNVERGSYTNYQFLLDDLMNSNVRLNDAIIEFHTKINLGEIDSFDYSEIALSLLDNLC